MVWATLNHSLVYLPTTSKHCLAERAVIAYETLKGIAMLGNGVIASYPTSNLLPAWAPVRVPFGYGTESYPRDLWEARVRAFLSSLDSLIHARVLRAMLLGQLFQFCFERR